MDPLRSTAIDVVEAAYDLELTSGDWLPNLLRVGDSLFDLGLGYYGLITAGTSKAGIPKIAQVQTSPGAEDLPIKMGRSAQEESSEVAEFSDSVKGRVVVLSELRDRWPRTHGGILRHVGCEDLLALSFSDPDFHGMNVTIPSPRKVELTPRQRGVWQMIGVHLVAGYRLRRGSAELGDIEGTPITEIPLNAEALLDPTRFVVSQAEGTAQNATASEKLRDAARRVDQARASLRKKDPEEALRIWKGLVRGRWSLVDWFDTDGRRFVLAKPNPPNVRDPRGLTEREAQVATFASYGDSSKLISYRLGLSESHVSKTLKDARRKLGVKTKAQLVEKMRWCERRS